MIREEGADSGSLTKIRQRNHIFIGSKKFL